MLFKRTISVLLLLSLISVSVGADPPQAPQPRQTTGLALVQKSDGPVTPTTDVKIENSKPVTAAIGTKCIVTVETTAKKVTWRMPAGVEYVSLNGKQAAVWALPGTYTLVAQVPAGDDVLSADVVLTITGSITPPVIDTFLQDVQAAYTRETATDKKVNVGKLASLYRTAATQTVPDPTVKTYGDLFKDMKTASEALIPVTAIPDVRKVVGVRLNKTMNNPATAIDRVLAASEFNAVATALELASKESK